MTDEALTSLGMKVPDLLDYSSTNDLVDFSKDLNEQLSSLIDLTENEVVYIKDTVDNMHYADDQ
jgi:hypothetical protein